jgi:hypothetical protein
MIYTYDTSLSLFLYLYMLLKSVHSPLYIIMHPQIEISHHSQIVRWLHKDINNKIVKREKGLNWSKNFRLISSISLASIISRSIIYVKKKKV